MEQMLKKLKPSVTDLSAEAGMALIERIRSDRIHIVFKKAKAPRKKTPEIKIQKQPRAKRTTKRTTSGAKRKAQPTMSPSEIFANLPPEMRAELLSQMQKGAIPK